MTKIIYFCYLICAMTHSSCNDSSATENNTINTPPPVNTTLNSLHSIPYKLDEPAETYEMPSILEEISGLTISTDEQFLYAVQDEKGIIFKLSKSSGEVLEKIKFHKDGDYEGIEVVRDKIYVVKSTGTIYEVTNPGAVNQQMKKFNDFLERENDVEGLAYDAKNNRLLLACKGMPATGESFDIIRYKKVIYAFDLNTKTFLPDPVYTIQLEEIRKYLDSHTSLKEYEKLVEFFSSGKDNLSFNPSAIAIHPKSGAIYVSSSIGKVLIVLSDTGKVLHIEKLRKKVHAQPEGLAFDKEGTLYISNEGKGGKAKIHKFDYRG